jgi:type I site-specific restriction endonuclease
MSEDWWRNGLDFKIAAHLVGHYHRARFASGRSDLWGNDGQPLASVEAKKTRRDARVEQQRAKL